MLQFTARRFDTGQLIRVAIDNREVRVIEPIDGDSDFPWVAPGLIDLQINGFAGQEFNDAELTTAKVEEVCLRMDATGVTGFCPTATTHSHEMLSHTLRVLAESVERSPIVASRSLGIHLEGPYISPDDGPRGAHPLEHCRPPTWDEFRRLQDAAAGGIRILTLSPEYEGSADFIERVVETGVVVAIGHTAANGEQIRAAVEAGARASTHLGNGAHGQLRRHPNYLWDQLADDRLTATLIADGFHLPEAVLKTFVRAKTPPRCVLVSDLVGMAGMPPGRYQNTSVGDVEILEDGRIVVAGQRQYLAGAGLPLTFGIPNAMRFADVTLKTAIEMATKHPASLIAAASGRLAPGGTADLVLFDLPEAPGLPLQVKATINSGQLVYGQLPG